MRKHMVGVFSIADMSEFPINHHCGDFKRLLDTYQIFRWIDFRGHYFSSNM